MYCSSATSPCNPPSLNDGDPFWASRLIVCVDNLGEAKKLVALDHNTFELSTTEGVFTIVWELEPAYHVLGFVMVRPVGAPEKCGPYYFDPRVAAALLRYHGNRYNDDLVEPFMAKELPLLDLESSWDSFRKRESFGSWALSHAWGEVTWTDLEGTPIWDPAHDLELYDLSKLRNHPRSLATLPKRLSYLAKLDYRLRKIAMLTKPDVEYQKLYDADPFEYYDTLNNGFVGSRMSHYRRLDEFLKSAGRSADADV